MNRRAKPRGENRDGFTVLELLTAMALLAALGGLLVSLIQNSFDMYAAGDRRADLYQSGLHVLSILEDDLLSVHAGPEGRLLLFSFGEGGEGPTAGLGDGFLLRLVRSIPNGELNHPHLRNAGGAPGAAEPYAGKDPGIGKRKDLAPPSGIMEVAYALIQDKDSPDGVLTLYRGVRTPALEKGGFFDDDAGAGFDEKWVTENLTPVATDILGLWLLCFGQDSEEWLEDEVMGGRTHQGGSYAIWDSTRGILDRDTFPLALGRSSRDEPRDDVYPRKVRIVAHMGRGWSPDATLRRRMETGQTEMLVNSTAAFPPADSETARYVKVGREWMLISNMDSSSAKVVRHSRGSRKARKPLDVASPVFAGRVFRKTLDLPATRSNWMGDSR